MLIFERENKLKVLCGVVFYFPFRLRYIFKTHLILAQKFALEINYEIGILFISRNICTFI
jgi:hypothetical protein